MPQDREHEIQLQFLEEAQDHLQVIESKLLRISTTAGIEGMDAVMRSAHSLKGGAAVMGFQTLSDLAHRLENFFKVLKAQPHTADAVVDLLLAAVDCLRQVVTINRQTSIVDRQWLTREVNPVFEQLYEQLGEPNQEEDIPMSPSDGLDMTRMLFETEVEAYLQQLESVLANSAEDLVTEVLAVAQDLSDLGEMLQLDAFTNLCQSIAQNLADHPEQKEEIARSALQAWRQSQAAVIVGQIDTIPSQFELNPITEAPAAAPALLTPLGSELKPELAPSTAQLKEQDNTVRVPLKQLEQLSDLFGELTIERSGLDIQIDRLRKCLKTLDQKVRSLQQDTIRQANAYPKSVSLNAGGNLQQSCHVKPTQLSRLSEVAFPPQGDQSPQPSYRKSDREVQGSDSDLIASEVMANIVQLQEVTDDIDLCLQETEQFVGDLNRTARQLHTCITQLRMRPFSDLVSRFPRALRELASQYGKNVELKLQGLETLIDRSILEVLNDPLMHLLRNAFDHGIEDPETRRTCGKPEQGTIEIKATYRGNQTLITFRDDGRGIAVDKVRSRAQQLGLDAEAIAIASDEEILNLIFEPGFSTAEQVTALSGRGVGMDVVRTNLCQIRGEIEVDTQLGLGTTFTISVPLTLSVARVLIVESKGMLLAFPTTAIEEMLLPTPEQISHVDGAALHWREKTVPLIYLRDWLKFRYHQVSAEAEAVPLMGVPTVLLIAQGNEWVGLQVDRCWGEQEVAIRPVEGAIPLPPGFTGCTILGDGRVVPLVDPPELLHWIASCERSPQLELGSHMADFQSHKTILVVDDSINVRRFLSLALEKAGYRVEQAKDGQDALEKLLSGLQIAAAICDIDMPRLDGYGFLARIKSNPTFKQLPIIMLTSRNTDRERQLATNLGATAYFSKPYNKQELLETLVRLVEN